MSMMQFRYTEWGTRKPHDVERAPNGELLVAKNVHAIERDGVTIYAGEIAIMSESAYAAYIGAQAVASRREQEIVDETILALINEGSL